MCSSFDYIDNEIQQGSLKMRDFKNAVINDWNGEEDADENDEYILSHENFFTDENFDF
jgi:hypothetical protein